jgi:hypothetical protein
MAMPSRAHRPLLSAELLSRGNNVSRLVSPTGQQALDRNVLVQCVPVQTSA